LAIWFAGTEHFSHAAFLSIKVQVSAAGCAEASALAC